jgi:hypothetical protein
MSVEALRSQDFGLNFFCGEWSSRGRLILIHHVTRGCVWAFALTARSFILSQTCLDRKYADSKQLLRHREHH